MRVTTEDQGVDEFRNLRENLQREGSYETKAMLKQETKVKGMGMRLGLLSAANGILDS